MTPLIWRKPDCVGANWGPMAALFGPSPDPVLPQHRAMQPELERSDQVVARVVAWHNRHPLATRITADQVHSVGVVSLPFAVQGAEVQALPAPAAAEPPPAPPADPMPDAAVELAIEAPEAAAATSEAAGADAPDLSQAALDGAAEPTPSDEPPAPAPSEALPPPPEPLHSTLPPRPRSWHPLTWWRRLRGGDPFRPLFSEDFIEPLRPRRVARWAAMHGVGQSPLAAGAPRRLVGLDPQRRRQDDAAPELELHVITAAIGVGDQRVRLLLAPGARGAILGARHWSRPRMATAGALLMALLLPLAALPWLRDGAAGPAVAAAAPAAPAAMATASSTGVTVAASAPVASAPAAVPTAAVAAASAPPAASPEPAVAAPAPAATPPDVPPRRGRIEFDPLVPRLAAAERQELRRHGRDLRGEPAVRVEAKAWALVTAPLDQRRAERAAAQLQAVALFQALPMRVEQLPVGQRWRAVFWPFTSAQDAEKVRLALADKGLQTEVLEF